MKQTQTQKLYHLLKDGRAHRTDEIVAKVYSGGSLARVGGRINDLANGNWPGKIMCDFLDESGNPIGTKKGDLKGWHDRDNPSLFWYRMKAPPPPVKPRVSCQHGFFFGCPHCPQIRPEKPKETKQALFA